MPAADDLKTILPRRFVEAAVTHQLLQAVLYVGRSEAFPSQILGATDYSKVSWILARPSELVPMSTHIASLHERSEVLAFFGDEAAFATYEGLSRIAIETFQPYRRPDGHQMTESKFPAAAWTRWLFGLKSNRLEQYAIYWSVNCAAKTAKSNELGEYPFDPFKDRAFKRLRDSGHREWGCLGLRFSVSLFIVAADAFDYAEPRSGETKHAIGSTSFLSLEVDGPDRVVGRNEKTVCFEGKNRPWKLFHVLFCAREAGKSRSQLMTEIWGDKVVNGNNLDQQKVVVDNLLGPLGVEIETDQRGVWRLAAVRPS